MSGHVSTAASNLDYAFARTTISRQFPGLWESWTEAQRADAEDAAKGFRPIITHICEQAARIVRSDS